MQHPWVDSVLLGRLPAPDDPLFVPPVEPGRTLRSIFERTVHQLLPDDAISFDKLARGPAVRRASALR